MSSLAEAAGAEIEALHAHLVALFTGRTRSLARCDAAFAADFSMVGPSGRRLDRPAILGFIANASAPPDFHIRIGDLRSIWESDTAALLQYVEEQYRGGRTTRRLSSALFTAERGAPLGVVWRYLQETWLVENQGQEIKNSGGNIQ